MKTLNNIKNNSTVKTIVTVFITLTAVSALACTFYMGMQYQKGINDSVTNQVKELATATQLKK